MIRLAAQSDRNNFPNLWAAPEATPAAKRTADGAARFIGDTMRTYLSEGGQQWFIRFTCATHTPAGKRISWTRTNPKSFGPGMKTTQWLSENLPSAFHGCEVQMTTLIHHNSLVVDPDYPHVCNFLAI